MINRVSLEINKTSEKILSISVIIMMLAATFAVSSMSLLQIAMAQNATSSNLVDTTNAAGVNATAREPAIIPGKFIAKLEDPAELAGMGIAARDPGSALTADLKSEGFDANVTRVLAGTNTLVMQIEPSPGSELAGVAAVDQAEITETIEQILEENPLVESAQADMFLTIPRPITSANTSTTSTQTIPLGVDRVDSELPLSEFDIVNADIAILDTGVNPHPDLNLFREVSFVGTNPQDNCGHGTHVAGTAAAKNNSEGVVSAAPNARIWNVKVLEAVDLSNPDLGCGGSLESILGGLNYVIENAESIDVINLSLGGWCPVWYPGCDQPVYEGTINDVVDSGVVVVVAAGNSAEDAVDYIPARFQNVITVSSISDSDGKCGGQGPPLSFGDNDETFAYYSNYGTAIDIASPGSDILSTWNDGSYNIISGTSMASPHVAGVAALYKSLHPEASPSDVYSALLTAATTPNQQCDGNGRGYFEGDPDGISEPLLYGGNHSSFQQGTELNLTLPQ
jgi:subtilisin family serine protease